MIFSPRKHKLDLDVLWDIADELTEIAQHRQHLDKFRQQLVESRINLVCDKDMRINVEEIARITRLLQNKTLSNIQVNEALHKLSNHLSGYYSYLDKVVKYL